MWGSSSGYVGSNNLSSNDSGSITNIAQYIEDYIDLVENIPNEISRNISRLHEYNNRYYQLIDQLEKYWETLASGQCYLSNGVAVDRVVNGESDSNVTTSLTTISTNLSKTATTITTTATKNSKCNHPQENGPKSDKKNGNGSGTKNGEKQTFDQKKGLRAVYHIQKCLIEIQEIADEKLFIVQSILDQLDAKARQLDFDYRNVTVGALANNLNTNSSKSLSSSAANSDSTNHVTDLNGVANNLEIAAAGSGGGGIGGKGGDITSTKDSNTVNTNGTSLGASVNNCTTTTTTTPTTNSSSLSNKRSSSRRNLSSNKQEISNGETTNHKRGVKRGVKGSGKEIKRSKSNKDLLNTSPPTLYEDTPIDPDEPTYCSCEQVSYGEMICCDNAQCQIEWFHFACVSLTTKPKGKWYCPNCRGDRSNIPKK